MSGRRRLALLGGLLALVAAADFSQRVYVGRDPALRAFEQPEIRPLPAPVAAAAVRARMREWLPTLGGQAPAAGATVEAPELALQGVFVRRGQATAVFALRSPAGATIETKRAAEGDVVQGWTVKRIDRRGVTLQRDGGLRQLLLFRREDGGAVRAGPVAE